ncbi:MAG: dihydropyrimidinase [Candidatus Dormibacteraceae bacterium]
MLVRGGTLVTAAGERAADVRLHGELIAEVGAGLEAAAGEEVIEAAGLIVLPGLVDPHTHFALDAGTGATADDFSTGSAAAAAGGVTTYVNFATQHPGQSFREALAAARAQAEGATHVDFSLHLNITRLDDGWERELDRVVGGGVSSAKVYTTYKDSVFYVDDWTIYRLMERSGGAGLLVQMHAENDDILQGRRRQLIGQGRTQLSHHGASRPAVAESEAVQRGLFLSRVTGSPIYLVHLSSPLSVDLVAEARVRGETAFAETCPHYLVLDESLYQGADARRYLMTPPLRSREVQAALWRRLEAGLIQSVGSDHCGYSLAQRGEVDDFTRVSPGIPGVEMALALLHTFGVRRGRLDLAGLVRLLSTNPARIFGLWPRKGRIDAGADADLVLFDPAARGRLSAGDLHGAAGFSPYEGLELEGRVRTTICRGRVVYDGVRVTGDATWGRFLERQPFDRERLADLR